LAEDIKRAWLEYRGIDFALFYGFIKYINNSGASQIMMRISAALCYPDNGELAALYRY
jgi:hypothetical protein